MLRNHDQVHAETFGDPQNRAKILRIGDAVEDEHEVGFLAIGDLVEIRISRFRDIRYHAVVHAAAGEPIDLIRLQDAHGHTGFFCSIEDSARVGALCDRNVVDALRVRSNRLENGVHTVNDH